VRLASASSFLIAVLALAGPALATAPRVVFVDKFGYAA
jgi:hypothetical protein